MSGGGGHLRKRSSPYIGGAKPKGRPTPRYIRAMVWSTFDRLDSDGAHTISRPAPGRIRASRLEQVALQRLRGLYPEPAEGEQNLTAVRTQVERLIVKGELLRVTALGTPSPRGFYLRRTSLLEQLAFASQGGEQ